MLLVIGISSSTLAQEPVSKFLAALPSAVTTLSPIIRASAAGRPDSGQGWGAAQAGQHEGRDISMA